MSRVDLLYGVIRSPELLLQLLTQASVLNRQAELQFTRSGLAIGAASVKGGATVWMHLSLDYVFVGTPEPRGEGSDGAFELSIALIPLCRALRSFDVSTDVSMRICGRLGRPAVTMFLETDTSGNDMNIRHRLPAVISGSVSARPVPAEPDVGVLDTYAEFSNTTRRQIVLSCETLKALAPKIAVSIVSSRRLLTLACGSSSVRVQMSWPIDITSTDSENSNVNQNTSVDNEVDFLGSSGSSPDDGAEAIVATKFWQEALQIRPHRMICGVGKNRVVCVYCFLRPDDDDSNFLVYYLADLSA